MDYTLPASTYQQQPRQARGTPLNTIIEEGQVKSDSSDTDEGTVIGRPSELDEKLFVAVPRERRHEVQRSAERHSDILQEDSRSRPADFDDMYDVSDNETEFSGSCPSLGGNSMSSRPTSFGTDSTRLSVASNRSSRNRYPSLLIPSTASLPSLASPNKHSPIPPTPPPKIPVSPAVLDLLPSLVPALNATPSLDGSSMTSEHVTNISAPVTPDMQAILDTGDEWGRGPMRLHMETDIPQDHSSEEDVASELSIVIEHQDDWSAALDSFPTVSHEMQQQSLLARMEEQRQAEQAMQTPSETGVELPFDALETLWHLSGEELMSNRSDTPKSDMTVNEMAEVYNPPNRPHSADGITPASEESSYSFSELSIPSPGGFFSSLEAGSRNTWVAGLNEPEAPTSAIAERFYKLPWEDQPMERIIEVEESGNHDDDDPPTARQEEFDTSIRRESVSTDDDSTGIRETSRTPGQEYDETYENDLLQSATVNLDRTSVWLAAQTAYLSFMKQPGDEENQQDDAQQKEESTSQGQIRDSTIERIAKKAVRFQEEPTSKGDEKLSLEETRRDSIFYRGFQYVTDQRKRRDAYVHQTPRFDAVQAARTATIKTHIDMLLGKYEIVEPWRPKYSGPFSQNPRQTGDFGMTPAQISFMKVEREKQALDQLEPASWVVDAIRYLNGARLLTSPASQRLAKASIPLDDPRCVGKKRFRVLDFGGQGSCDWAWHCADEFPNVKVYTVATKQQVINVNVNGPCNHRVVSVPHLWQLPFRNGHFDLISARSLHAMLRTEGDGTRSDFEMCLQECLRVLKPGGYIEYTLMDASIGRAGPLATAMSVEFGFNLRTRGYDPEPTRSFISRLRKARFTNIKSAWLYLPLGAESHEQKVLRETPFPQCPSVTDLANYEAVQGPVGSTTQVANVAGLLGGWMWEQWMLKLQKEMGKEEGEWLKGVGDVVDEGRNIGSGYKVLTGWAQKPLRKRKRLPQQQQQPPPPLRRVL